MCKRAQELKVTACPGFPCTLFKKIGLSEDSRLPGKALEARPLAGISPLKRGLYEVPV